MTLDDMHTILSTVFAELNVSNQVPTADDIQRLVGGRMAIVLRDTAPEELRRHLTEVTQEVWSPVAVEVARLLLQLKQRLSPDQPRPAALVERMRADSVVRRRPPYDQPAGALTGSHAGIARLDPGIPSYSRFQLDGWTKVLDAIQQRGGLIIEAPTSSGKTQIFLMPVIFSIASALRNETSEVPRFVLVYPRRALLRDQLSRILRYVYFAQRDFSLQTPLVIGFQFKDIKPEAEDTLRTRSIFSSDRRFVPVPECPNCGVGTISAGRINTRLHAVPLACSNCDLQVFASISKNDHPQARPQILVTTAESLDLLYLGAKVGVDEYLRSLTGIIFDEVHLYYSLYGAHIHNLIRSLEQVDANRSLVKIGASATVGEPRGFANKLFYGDENGPVQVHSAGEAEYCADQEPAGLEVVYLAQATEKPDGTSNSPATLIQSVLCLGHALLSPGSRIVVFTDSVHNAQSYSGRIRNAETTRWQGRGLWTFRTQLPALQFRDNGCPRTDPQHCPSLYQVGECWRGVLGGTHCWQELQNLRQQPQRVRAVSSFEEENYTNEDVVVATPSLEVGVDDPAIRSTVHYRVPKEVFSLIQRRGRAGRALGDVAFTLLVLGNAPADLFYYFQRHRLLSANYELPLNPRNCAVSEMHRRLRDARNEILRRDREETHHLPRALWSWIRDQLLGCSLLQGHYGDFLQQLGDHPFEYEQQLVRDWIDTQTPLLERYLSLQWLLHQIENEVPDEPELVTLARGASQAVRDYLENQGTTQDQAHEALDLLTDALGRRINRVTDETLNAHLDRMRGRVRDVFQATLSHERRTGTEDFGRLYDFFRTLRGLYEHEATLRFPPYAMKIVLQAMFYLHLGLAPEREMYGCESRIDYFIPDAYFSSVKPIIVEYWELGAHETRLHEFKEDPSQLASLLIPYRPVYRYFAGGRLSLVDTDFRGTWRESSGLKVVQLDLRATGIPDASELGEAAKQAQKVGIRNLSTDPDGNEFVRICEECCTVFGFDSHTICHGRRPRVARLRAEAQIERAYTHAEPVHVSRTLGLLDGLSAVTRVLGANVSVRNVIDQGGTFQLTRNELFAFVARYRTPISYRLQTKGIAWSLGGVVEEVLADGDLRQAVEAVQIGPQHQQLDAGLVLHTAAHMLVRAISAISGVNLQSLEYAFREDSVEAVVWERYEGGCGISETFVDAARTRPVQVYRELLASVLCPVQLSENRAWSSERQLREELADTWALSFDDDVLRDIAQGWEAEIRTRERTPREEHPRLCSETDGCPACVQLSECLDRQHQETSVSRLVGEALLRRLVHRGPSTNRPDENSSEASLADVPAVLRIDPHTGHHDFLLL